MTTPPPHRWDFDAFYRGESPGESGEVEMAFWLVVADRATVDSAR